MKRKGRLSIIRFLCLYLIVDMVYFSGLSIRITKCRGRSGMIAAFFVPRRAVRKQCSYAANRERRHPFSSETNPRIGEYANDKTARNRQHFLKSHRIGVIGGGLAGLSTAYHILKKSPSADVTIIDRQPPGAGGASAVAGGLLHPLSPKGKLAYRGLEGLASANELVGAACRFEENAVLRNKIYRIATKEAQAATFQKTAAELPELATWIARESSSAMGESDDTDGWEERYFDSEEDVLGVLKLAGDCKVLHMESYLKGLWLYCESIGSGNKTWITYEDMDGIHSEEWKERLAPYDCVVFAAGSGLFQSSLLDPNDFPITLVRGQSIEMTLGDDDQADWNAILCGKYVSPLPGGRAIIGATHEFKEERLTPEEVENELKERSYHFASGPWDNGRIDNVTIGYRVQSNRGPYGRLPIVGKLETPHHHNSWVFTGLSGRGILYHGIYGDSLSDMILENSSENDYLLETINWWRKQLDHK